MMDESDDSGGADDTTSADDDAGPRRRVEAGANRAVDGFDQGIVDLLSWLLDTETRARIYISLRKAPDQTSEEVAENTGLYPSTVRESLAELTEDEVVTRSKRESDGAGNNPYEYRAIAPSDLVRDVAGQLQDQLNTICNLDRSLDKDAAASSEPIRIDVRNEGDQDT